MPAGGAQRQRGGERLPRLLHCPTMPLHGGRSGADDRGGVQHRSHLRYLALLSGVPLALVGQTVVSAWVPHALSDPDEVAPSARAFNVSLAARRSWCEGVANLDAVAARFAPHRRFDQELRYEGDLAQLRPLMASSSSAM